MSARKPTNHAFVLRLWREDDDDDDKIWRGWIQHVGTGEATTIQDGETLLHFIERWTGQISGESKSLDTMK